MVGYRDNDGMLRDEQPRLETPRAAGYRQGMSETTMIGRKLARVFDVSRDVPREMGTLIRSLDDGPAR